MQTELGKEYAGLERINFLSNNADEVEQKGYMKQFTAEEIESKKDELAEVSILINDIEEEKRAAMELFKLRLKPLATEKGQLLTDIKQKTRFVKEDVYKFTDYTARKVGYYNGEGDLVEMRPALAGELQKTLFSEYRGTGTND